MLKGHKQLEVIFAKKLIFLGFASPFIYETKNAIYVYSFFGETRLEYNNKPISKEEKEKRKKEWVQL